ncbi:MAG: hypothetical protein O9302_13505 [Cyclobacteriaceae bacterium]|jgi:hypothetical protein|nr:hypothetical protein [Cytophagales bacterium]MCZ8329076.1 hypothetical protein [Cyclobacteriaceae bacterium]
MKKIILLTLVLAYTSTVMLAGTVDDPGKTSEATVVGDANGHVKVFYKGSDTNLVTISIYDQDNNLKFRERIKGKNQFIRPYDLSALDRGNYRIVVDDQENTHTRMYTNYLQSNLVAHIQKIKQTDSSYLLTVSDPLAEEIQVDVVDANGNILLTHKLTGKGQFAQVYTLSKLQEDVSFRISSDSGTVTTEK